MTININDNIGIVKSPEFTVEADVLWDYVINFVKEHYQDSRFDNQIILLEMISLP